MIKRWCVIWMTIIYIAGLGNVLACAMEKNNFREPLAQTDFCVGFVHLGDDFDKIKNGFEPPLIRVDRKLWGNDGRYHSTWKNSGAEIVVTELPDMQRVDTVRISANQYCTLRGVRVGDSVDDIICTYGEPHWLITTDEDKRLLYNMQREPNPYINNLIFVSDPASGKIKSIWLYDAMAE